MHTSVSFISRKVSIRARSMCERLLSNTSAILSMLWIVDGLWLTLARSWYITIAFEVDQ